MSTKRKRNSANPTINTKPTKTTWTEEEGELYDWMLTQRLLATIGQLEDWKLEAIEELMPDVSWLYEEPTDQEIGHALLSKNPELNDALAQHWNYHRMSPLPMTFAEIRAKATREIGAPAL